MTRRLFLVRHGPTHAQGMVGWTDLPADLSGTEQLARLERHLPDDAVVVSSDLIRAVRTADQVQKDRHRLPHTPALREINFGEWELRTWKDISTAEPDRIRAFYETPGDISAPGGDSWYSLKARVDPAIDGLLAAHSSDVVVVCHFGVILSQLQRATGQTAYETFSNKIDNLSVTEIVVRNGTWQAERINHIP